MSSNYKCAWAVAAIQASVSSYAATSGAGARAGVIQLITNKPKLNTIEGDVSGPLRQPRGLFG